MTGKRSHSLSAAFLQELVTALDGENTLGVVLVGSFARRQGGRYSDVDLWHFVRRMPETPGFEANYVHLRGSILVSCKTLTLEEAAAELHKPQSLVWALPAWRQARLLLDREGALAALKRTAETFDWSTVQPDADRFASRELATFSEEIQKVLDGLAEKDEGKTVYGLWGLCEGMPKALMVQHGVFIPTENAFIRLAQDTAGHDSAWSRAFRLAIGLDAPPPGEPPYVVLGMAGLRLYQETAALLQACIQPADAPVIARTLDLIHAAGY